VLALVVVVAAVVVVVSAIGVVLVVVLVVVVVAYTHKGLSINNVMLAPTILRGNKTAATHPYSHTLLYSSDLFLQLCFRNSSVDTHQIYHEHKTTQPTTALSTSQHRAPLAWWAYFFVLVLYFLPSLPLSSLSLPSYKVSVGSILVLAHYHSQQPAPAAGVEKRRT